MIFNIKKNCIGPMSIGVEVGVEGGKVLREYLGRFYGRK